MPASASTDRPEDLIGRLKSSEGEAKLKALRELKNQIIGNRTKKLSYIKLGAVPTVVGILAGSAESDVSLIVQSAAAIGSFSCDVDAGVKAVLDSGAFPHLFRALSNPDAKSEICQKCGVRGYVEYLIYCSQCKESVEHRYCLDILPGRDVEDENVTWSCDRCAPRAESYFNRLSLQPFRRSVRLSNVKRKKAIKFSKAETNVQNSDTTTALQSHKLCLKGDTQMNEDIPDPAEVTTDPFACSHQYSSDGNHEGAKKSQKQRRKLILPDEGSSDEDTGSAEDRNSLVASDVRNAPFGLSSHEPSPEWGYCDPAQPIIDPVWRGCFSICNEKSGEAVGIVAHLSNKACLKVLEGANALPVLLGVEMLPRSDAWPKSFSRFPPTDDNIGLYFFPERKCDEAVFNGLLYEIIDRDFALKSVTENAELLIFSSLQLPPPFQRFHGKHYLWGLFRGKKVSHLPQLDGLPSIQDCSIEGAVPSMSTDDFGSRKGRGRIKTWGQWSPLSPLSMSSSYGSDSAHSPLHQKAMSSGFPAIIEKSVDNEQDMEKQHAYQEGEELHEFENREVKMKDCDVVLLHNGEPWLDSFAARKENIGTEGPCLELFPLEMEGIAVVSKVRSRSEVDLELALGQSGRGDSKSRSRGCKQLIGSLGLNNSIF